MFEDMFTPCLIAYLFIVWYMFTQYLKTHSDYSWRHAYTMFEVIFVMFEDMIIPCLKLVYEDSIQIVLTYLHYVSKYFHTMYEDMFTQRHPVDGIFTKCSFIQNWSNCSCGWKWIQIPKKIFLKCFKIYHDISKGLKQYSVFSYFFYCSNL